VLIHDAHVDAYKFLRIERPPLLWAVACDERAFERLLAATTAATGSNAEELILNMSNMVVQSDAADALMPAGDYVAITVAGEGAWAQDARWGREEPVPEGILASVSAAMLAAGAAGAYSRALGDRSSVTVLLPRA
jgi:hypothetical protein